MRLVRPHFSPACERAAALLCGVNVRARTSRHIPSSRSHFSALDTKCGPNRTPQAHLRSSAKRQPALLWHNAPESPHSLPAPMGACSISCKRDRHLCTPALTCRVCTPPPEGMYTTPTGTNRIAAGQSVAEKNLPLGNCAYPQGDRTYPKRSPRIRKQARDRYGL